jgi:hypothetical protein
MKMAREIDKQWDVMSFVEKRKKEGTKYRITLYKNGRWACSCPHWKFRCNPHPEKWGKFCKHIKWIMQENIPLVDGVIDKDDLASIIAIKRPEYVQIVQLTEIDGVLVSGRVMAV